MAQKVGGFGKDADFPKAESEDRTVAESEVNDPAFLPTLTKSSLNARQQNPYGPQYPALDRYFKAK